MDFNTPENIAACYSIVKDASSLLFYSHIPTAMIALIVGIFILIKDKGSLISRILFFITLSFFAWSAVDLLVWFTYDKSTILMLGWSVYGIIYALIFALSLYFAYVYFDKKDISITKKILIGLLVLPVIILTPTSYNLSGYENINCIATEGYIFTNYYYFLGLAIVIWIMFLGISRYRKANDAIEKKQIFLMTLGIELFLASFFAIVFVITYLIDTGYIGNGDYSLEQYALFSMPIFIGFLAYLIVKFKTFNIKMFGAQALIVSLVAIIGSEFFFITTNVNRILTAVTLVITGFIGINLMRSVKREIEQREKIEDLALKLEKTNAGLEKANDKLKELDQLKSEFVSLATHQIRAPLSAIKGYLSEVFEGDFGPYSKELEKPLQIVFQSTENLVHIVGDFLNISRIEQGKMKYELAPLDMKALVTETSKELKPNLDRVGLQLNIEIPDDHYEVYADAGKIKQVIGNLIDNAMKYTPKGAISISLSLDHEKQKVLFAIKDTGIGIPAEVIPKLFQKFVRAKGANEVNIIGTGLGLYVAKLMIEGQRGRIWAESEGAGKGSQFYVELPVAHVS